MPAHDTVVPVKTGGALDLIVLDKEALIKEPNVATSRVEYGTLIGIGEGFTGLCSVCILRLMKISLALLHIHYWFAIFLTIGVRYSYSYLK